VTPDKASAGEVFNIVCDKPLTGSYIKIHKSLDEKALGIAEVKVYGVDVNETVMKQKGKYCLVHKTLAKVEKNNAGACYNLVKASDECKGADGLFAY